eukprot:Transcript_410.p1 GENE.Transcript_410~~Transcript_410.p1  ORF type:complete len:135 (+),score=28.09 Transcript_410:58-405(+)
MTFTSMIEWAGSRLLDGLTTVAGALIAMCVHGIRPRTFLGTRNAGCVEELLCCICFGHGLFLFIVGFALGALCALIGLHNGLALFALGWWLMLMIAGACSTCFSMESRRFGRQMF